MASFTHTVTRRKEKEEESLPLSFVPPLGEPLMLLSLLSRPSVERRKRRRRRNGDGRRLHFPQREGRKRPLPPLPSVGKSPSTPIFQAAGGHKSVGRRVKERRTRDDFVHQRHAAEKICFPHWQDRRSTSIIPPLPRQRRKTASIFPGPLASPHEIGG